MSKVYPKPTKDPDLIRYLQRVQKREARHGDWRQIYLDCAGMCQYKLEGDIICGETEGLEFHELFGEAKNGESKFQQRVLLCNYHHWSVHGEKWVNKRHYPSMLQVDVQIELYLCGGMANWIEKYNLVEREVEYDIKTDSQADKADLDDSENTESNRSQL